MNYIFDIVLNFHENYYNFFEWNRTDKITKHFDSINSVEIKDKDYIE